MQSHHAIEHTRSRHADERASNPGPAKHARVSQEEAGVQSPTTGATATQTETDAGDGATGGSTPQALVGPTVVQVLTPDELGALGDKIVERLRKSGLAVAAVYQRGCVQANALVTVVVGCSERYARSVLRQEPVGGTLLRARWKSGPAISVCEIARVRALADAVHTQNSLARLSGDECESLFRVISDVYNRTAYTFGASPAPDEQMSRIPAAVDAPLPLLQAIEDALSQPDIMTELQKRAGCHHADGSIDVIGSGRVEVFVQGTGMDTTTWETLIAPAVGKKLHMSARAATDCLLQYAVRQASRDGRLPSSHIMNNFSLLISWGRVPCQSLHIDLLPPLWQFGVAISSECAATVWARRRVRVSSVADLRLVDLFATAPSRLYETLSQHQHVSDPDLNVSTLLGEFGQVFGSDPSLLVDDQAMLQPGDCLCLPGGVVHGGPAVGGRGGDGSGGRVRALLFFSACPPGQRDYDPKTV